MPILLDFSGTVHAGVHVDIRNNGNTSKLFLRHIILNQIRSIRKRFHKEYGEPIICMDSKVGYWRRDIFAPYKIKRKEAREASDINWGEVFTCVNEIAEEIKDNLPYKVIYVPKAEADDIIGTLAIRHPWNTDEKILIVSNDHDFKQLHRIPNLEQYFPFSSTKQTVENPELFLVEHILKGDPGDGIPNVRSPKDVFLREGVRQKPVSRTYIKNYLTQGTVPECDLERFEENRKLIDLRNTPENIQDSIINIWEQKPIGSRFKLFQYLTENSLKLLTANINDF